MSLILASTTKLDLLSRFSTIYRTKVSNLQVKLNCKKTKYIRTTSKIKKNIKVGYQKKQKCFNTFEARRHETEEKEYYMGKNVFKKSLRILNKIRKGLK